MATEKQLTVHPGRLKGYLGNRRGTEVIVKSSEEGEEAGEPTVNELHLSRNRLTKLPDDIGRLQRLTRLWLHNNLLETLPASIGGLTALRELNVSNNCLTALPATLANLSGAFSGCSTWY